MSASVQVLVERYAAADALGREVEMLHKQVTRALAEVLRRFMDARYAREHGRSPDPLTWRTDRIKLSPGDDSLVVRGQYLYGDEWEPRTFAVEIPIAELAAAVPTRGPAGQGRAEPTPDREADLLHLLRREVEQVRDRLQSPEVRVALGPTLRASRAEAELATGIDCREVLREIIEILYSLGTQSPERLWVSIPIWAMREISRLLNALDAPDASDH